MVPQILCYFPGQTATFFLETKDGYGARANSVTTPIVTRVFAFNIADGYNLLDGYLTTDGYEQPTTKMDTGLYFVEMTFPKNASSIGSYLVDLTYTDPASSRLTTQTYQVVINAPYGNYSATVRTS